MSRFAFPVCSLVLWLTIVTPSSAQPGFINIDCGAAAGFTSTTNLTWAIDTGYISSGQVAKLPNPYNNVSLLFQTVRYFPEDTIKSCYELSPVTAGVGYVVRAGFYYGNYDGKGKMPTFALIIDATVMVDPVTDDSSYDMYVPAKTTSISVCLARSGVRTLAGVPFISFLQLLTIPSSTSYKSVVLDNGYGLYSIHTVDLGSNNSNFRYPYDTMDRIWTPFASLNNNLETTHEVEVGVGIGVDKDDYAPSLMLQTAITDLLVPYNMTRVFSTSKYHILFFFAEINPNVTAPGQRVFDLYSNTHENGLEPWVEGIDVFNATGGNFKSLRLFTSTPITPIDDSILITLKPSPNSTYGPIISGIQVLLYTDEPLSNLTYFSDVSTIQAVRDDYEMQGYDGDPCMPRSYSWSWIGCEVQSSSLNSTILRISSIFLSNNTLQSKISEHFKGLSELIEIHLDHNQLTGPIPDLRVLSNLQTLNLQNNNLSGNIPSWLGSLPSLKELSLQNNEFEGDVPPALLEKAANGKLNFTYGGNIMLTCNGQPCDFVASPLSPPQTMTPPPPSPKSSAQKNVPIFLILSFLHVSLSFFLKEI